MSSKVTQRKHSLSKDDIFDVLSNGRRRHTIKYLRQNGGPVELSVLAEKVAALENDKPVEDVTPEERKRVYVALQQSHLPKMREMDLVELGHDGIRLTETATDLDIYLEIVPKNDINWSQYYIGLSTLSTLLVIGSWAGMYPFSMLPKIGWAGVIVSFFLISAVVHTFHGRRMRVN